MMMMMMMMSMAIAMAKMTAASQFELHKISFSNCCFSMLHTAVYIR